MRCVTLSHNDRLQEKYPKVPQTCQKGKFLNVTFLNSQINMFEEESLHLNLREKDGLSMSRLDIFSIWRIS